MDFRDTVTCRAGKVGEESPQGEGTMLRRSIENCIPMSHEVGAFFLKWIANIQGDR